MFKKIIMASLITISAGSVFANGAPYLGASIGVIANTAKEVNANNYSTSNYRGVPFNVFVGYGGVLSNNFYLGGEVTGTLGVADLNDNGLKTSYGYGASLMPGFMLCDHTMSYARIGILSAHFPKPNVSRAGFQIGLGLETGLTQNVDIRGEYNFVSYRSVPAAPNSATEVSPRSDQVYLSVVYKFD